MSSSVSPDRGKLAFIFGILIVGAILSAFLAWEGVFS